MPTFVLMTKLAPDALHDAPARKARGHEWLERVQATCPGVEWRGHFALLGPYDFMDIYDAPDVETAHRVSAISRAQGAVTAESWAALPYDRYLDVLGTID